MPGGRPSKFRKVFKNYREQIKTLTENGLTDAQICQFLEINTKTYYNWQKRYKEFFLAVKDWKATADAKVERSLYERANGYEHPETKAQWVTDTVVVDGEPRIVGRWETLDMTKHYPPDPTSIIFWLKNRQPEKWRDKTDINHSGTVGTVVSLGDDDRKTVHEFLEAFKSSAIKESV